MKALELTVYPPIPPMPIGKWEIQERVMWWRDRADEMDAGESKRFTDAELAAEWQQEQRHMAVAVICGQPDALTKARRTDTLHRFATIPHYDEAQQ